MKREERRKAEDVLSLLWPDIEGLESTYEQNQSSLQLDQQQIIEFRFAYLKLSMMYDNFRASNSNNLHYTKLPDMVILIRRICDLFKTSSDGFTIFRKYICIPGDLYVRILKGILAMEGVGEIDKSEAKDMMEWFMSNGY